MKLTLFYIFFLTLTGLDNYQNANLSNSSEVSEIKIYYVDFTIETPMRIDCSKFNYFGKEIKLKKINDLKNVSSILNFIESSTEKTNAGIDTRFKMIIKYKSGQTKVVCGNEAFIETENGKYVVEKGFLNYLNKLLK